MYWYNLHMKAEFAQFDKLVAALREEMQKINSSDLDLLMSGYKNSLSLHRQCQEILQAAAEYVEQLDATSTDSKPTEWQGFRLTQLRIERLDNELAGVDTLTEIVAKYTEICGLIAQYQGHLDQAQNTIDTIEHAGATE